MVRITLCYIPYMHEDENGGGFNLPFSNVYGILSMMTSMGARTTEPGHLQQYRGIEPGPPSDQTPYRLS